MKPEHAIACTFEGCSALCPIRQSKLALKARREIADRIAAEHGCEIQSAAYGVAALVVLPVNLRGFPQDGQRLERCCAALRRAGINLYGWVS